MIRQIHVNQYSRLTTTMIILFLIFPILTFSQIWRLQKSPSNRSISHVFFVDKNHGWITLSSDSVYCTVDGGKIWKGQSLPSSQTITSIFFLDTLRGWITGKVTESAGNGVIFHTVNGGKTWVIQKSFPLYYINDVFFINNTIGWAAGENNIDSIFEFGRGIILKTTDGGNTWVLKLFTYSDIYTRCLLSVRFFNELDGMAVGGPPDIMIKYNIVYNTLQPIPYIVYTTDGGEKWSDQINIHGNYRGEQLSRVRYAAENIAWASGDYGLLVKTTDGGSNWDLMATVETSNPFNFNVSIKCLNVLDTNNIYVVQDFKRSKIYKTTDCSTSWNTDSLEFINRRILDLKLLDKNTGWAVGDSGSIWKLTEKTVDVKKRDEGKDLPSQNILYPNYPNPANPRTRIDYYIAKESNVRIEIYDILGKPVFILVNEKKKSGLYFVEFIGEQYTSGVYYYRMIANDFIQTKKLLLLK